MTAFFPGPEKSNQTVNIVHVSQYECRTYVDHRSQINVRDPDSHLIKASIIPHVAVLHLIVHDEERKYGWLRGSRNKSEDMSISFILLLKGGLPGVVISPRMTLDLSMAHTPGCVIWHNPVTGASYGGYITSQWEHVHCRWAATLHWPQVHQSLVGGNWRLDGERRRQLPYSGLNRWQWWQEINTVSCSNSIQHFHLGQEQDTCLQLQHFSNIRSLKKHFFQCDAEGCLSVFVFCIKYSFWNIWNSTLPAPNNLFKCNSVRKCFDVFLIKGNTAIAQKPSSNDNGEFNDAGLS